MRTIKQFMWMLFLSASTLLMFSGCSKFLDRKPLQTTLDDLNQGGLEGQIYGMYGAIRNGDVVFPGWHYTISVRMILKKEAAMPMVLIGN
jgi:hypothetical protein